MLRWDRTRTDFIECLECIPTGGSGVDIFETELDGLHLVVKVWEYESCIDVALKRSQHVLVSTALFVRGTVELKKEGQREYLLIADCLIVPDRFSYLAIGDPFDLELHPVGFDVEISIKPDITIRYERQYRPPR